MKAAVMFVAVCLLVSVIVITSPAADKSSGNSQALIARGRYLVEDAGTCQDCHTPRNEKGEFVREQWLMGSPIAFKPTVPMPVWAEKSARIAGLPGWTDEQAIQFLMTGTAYNGLPARPPMPSYRFSQRDAAAIVAYLRSLKPLAANVPSNKPSR